MSIDWVTLTMGLAGGLALFLIGMNEVTRALKALGDERLRWALARLSSNRVLGATTGAAVTAVIQSSSVTTVLTVGFVSAGLLSLWQSASVVIGANLGTTVTAQVIALDITDYALGMLAGGALVAVAARRQQLRQLGRAFAGIGVVFLGMETMSDAMVPLGSYEPFLDLVSDTSNPFTALLIGAVFTAMVQSSSATTGIVVVMAADGLLDLETGIAIILGANIGTCVTAVLAALGKGSEAMRTAAVHVTVNTVGALVWVLLIDQLADFVLWFTADTADAVPRQIANAHTVFNLVNTVVFLTLMVPLVRFVEWVVPDRMGASPSEHQAAFLDEDLLGTPVLALEVTRKELIRLGTRVRRLLDDAVPAALNGRRSDLDELKEREAEVDSLHAEIVAYLAEVGRGPIGERQRDHLLALLLTANLLEQLADNIETNVVGKGYQRLEDMVEVSASSASRIEDLHRAAVTALDLALEALGDPGSDAARRVRSTKQDFRDLEHAATEHLAARLAAPEPARVEAYSLEIELVDALRSVHRSCRRIARSVQVLEPGSGESSTRSGSG
ncbi:MAG: Na/Pi cotransporter family protein [Acidimicrobiales bacterium]